MAEPRVLLLLGTNVYTIYAALHFIRHMNVVGVIQQDNHFPFTVPNIFVDRGKLNDDVVLQWARNTKPDIFVSYGPERIGKGLINMPEFGGINVHWGMSPMYRGMYTSRWALLEGFPECVAVTLHMVDSELDTGDILYQTRPKMKPGDTYQSIEHRLSLLASSAIPSLVIDVCNKAIVPVVQDRTVGRQYMASEWTDTQEKELTAQYIEGLLKIYLPNKEERDKCISLINPWGRSSNV